MCNLDAEDIKKAARMYAKAENAGIYYAMGITQHVSGSYAFMALSNLAMLCGNIGKEFTGINPLRGQNNVQGPCDMGSLPGDYPGYQKVYKKEVREKFEKALKGVDFLVVQDIFLSETAAIADVVLPAASFAEKDGTFTNTERRVQLVRKAIEPVGESRPDWQIIMDIMNRLGMNQNYKHPSEIMKEIASLTPEYVGISYDRLEEVGIQWPCLDKDHPGTNSYMKESSIEGRPYL